MKTITSLIILAASFMALHSQPKIVKQDLAGIPVNLVEFNGLLFFPLYTSSDWDLWKSDGTAPGTALVKHFAIASSIANDFDVWNNHLYFLRDHELWETDGTPVGTILLKTFSSDLYLWDLTAAGDKLYFRTTSDESGTNELWKSNGTMAGTLKVADILPVIAGGTINDDPEFTYTNGLLFFWSTTDLEGGELWKSDGTAAGTVMVLDIYPGPKTSRFGFPGRMVSFGNKVYFAADNGATGTDLWTSDGTENGTVLLKNVAPSIESSFPVFMTVVGNTLFFNATDGIYGEELWKTDGTEQGTVMVKDIFPGLQGSYPAVLTNANGELYLNASDGIHGGEVWKSDGSAASTFMVKDISPGLANSGPEEFTWVNGKVFFTASEPSTAIEPWMTDGTVAGTQIVKDIHPGDIWSLPQFLTAVGNNLFFSADDGINGRTLWVYGTSLEEISDFTLVNALTDEDIGPINDGDVINLATLPTNKLNIKAETGLVSGSITFERNGVRVRTENSPPYAMAGDAPAGNYSIWTPAVGDYEVCATPYSGYGGTGVGGTTECIGFSVVRNTITHFTLVNAETDEDIQDLQEGDTIDLSLIPTSKLNIRANTNPPVVGSVSFGYGGDDFTHVENAAPYALFGDRNGDYHTWNFTPCYCFVSATAYSGINLGGDDLGTLDLRFHLINSSVSKLSENDFMKAEPETNAIQLYPNPNQGTFKVSVETVADLKVMIFNMFGKTIFQEEVLSFSGIYQREFDLSTYPQGVYLMRVNDGETTTVKKVVISER